MNPRSGTARDNGPDALDVALGRRIKARRCELKMTMDTLAKALGVSFQQIGKYELAQNRVSFSKLVHIAQALDCRVRDLVGSIDISGKDKTK